MGLSTQQGIHVWANKDKVLWRARIDGRDFDITSDGDEVRAYRVTNVSYESMRPFYRVELIALPVGVLEMLVRCIHRVAANR